MSVLKPIYKTLRSIIILLIMLVVVAYAGVYVLLSVPSVQDRLRMVACDELSKLLGGELSIGGLGVSPFSEVVLSDVSLKSPRGEECASIRRVAAGIDIWCLLAERRIVFNYAEIIGLDASLAQKEKDGDLNIRFLIDALSPKDRTKPPSRFDLRFRNIVVRDSRASFSRAWMIADDGTPLPFSKIELTDLRLDFSIPALKNDMFRFSVRNMQCNVFPGFKLRGLSGDIAFGKGRGSNGADLLCVRNFKIELPETSLSFGDVDLDLGSDRALVAKVEGYFTPSDLSDCLPAASSFDTAWDISLDASVGKDDVDIRNLLLTNRDAGSFVRLGARADGFRSRDSLNVDLRQLKAGVSGPMLNSIAAVIPGLGEKAVGLIRNSGDISVDMSGHLSESARAEVDATVETGIGSLKLIASAGRLKSRRPVAKVSLEADGMQLGLLAGDARIGEGSFTLDADVAGLDRNADCDISLAVGSVAIGGHNLSDIVLDVGKRGKEMHASLNSDDDRLRLDMEADMILDGRASTLDAFLDVAGLDTDLFGLKGKLAGSDLRFNLDTHAEGDNMDNLTGMLHISDLRLSSGSGKNLALDNFSLNIDSVAGYSCENHTAAARRVCLRSDWVDADMAGHISPATVAAEMKRALSSVLPSLIPPPADLSGTQVAGNDFSFDILVKGVADPYDYFGLPVCPLAEIPIRGSFDSGAGKLDLSLATPHMRQGKDKLIRDTSLKVMVDAFIGMAKVDASVIFPAKKGDVQLVLDMSGVHDKVTANVRFNPTFDSVLKGGVSLQTLFSKIPDPLDSKERLAVHVDILPSAVTVKETVWNIANGKIDYSGSNVSVSNFLIRHGNQFVKIDGVASEDPSDHLRIALNDIDLDYIFSILNIHYVTFGGMATGEVVGSRLLTKTPQASTRFLRVRNLSYNGAVLGNGDLASTFFPEEMKVGIYAVIKDPLTRERRANIDGGIWVTRDSLSFNFDADKVNLQLMKPFVAAFCSDLKGLGSGRCKLYGTFSDIDLVGKLRADTISMKIDFTNTWYHAGNDSVTMGKGIIDVKPLTLYDSEGHTEELSGWLRHRYFHDPVFNFKVRNARSILCYDTDEKQNPLWYGTIYGTGSGQIAGRPGLVEIDMNMTTSDNSRFFYVIGNAEETDNYSFLSFTDRRKQQQEEANDTVPDYLHRFMKKVSDDAAASSNVVLSLKGSVTNDALVTLIMDPVAGDKITARGQGALQMDYNMAANDFRMIGTYTLDEGSYYFTLQDIIIKNFNIRQGSRIRFNGDPMDAILNIAATYRVNTNLTDLDKSFASDKELNRTNVPVDAILLVDGPMTHPDIDFDIELPTLTSDVERKVKSIVSTNDMMSRQIIYLLALNRFYTPEYTSASGSSGAEWSSMASSTLSSQLSNILSNMTDKLNVAPSFRSDKGDFTDLEFDLALSSRLLNNRLLINGNFGYRDRQTSNTQFVGDFDIEYLLNKNGNLRLKAYNHFNDQNYYLRSALTTQGVGVVYRRDFDRLFNFRRKRKPKTFSDLFINNKERNDSTSAPGHSPAEGGGNDTIPLKP